MILKPLFHLIRDKAMRGRRLLRVAAILAVIRVTTPLQGYAPPGDFRVVERHGSNRPSAASCGAGAVLMKQASVLQPRRTQARLPTRMRGPCPCSALARIISSGCRAGVMSLAASREIGHDVVGTVDGRELVVRPATAEEMTTLWRKGEKLPNFLDPLGTLCAGALYGANYLQSAVSSDFQRRYGLSRSNRGVMVVALLKADPHSRDDVGATKDLPHAVNDSEEPLWLDPTQECKLSDLATTTCDMVVGCVGLEVLPTPLSLP